MSDTERYNEGQAMTAFAAGLLHSAITNLQRDGFLKMTPVGHDRIEDDGTPGNGFVIHCRTEAGFGIDVQVRLMDWSG